MALIKFRRGTRAEIDAAAGTSGLNQAEPYFVTDEAILAVGLSTTQYVDILNANNLFQNSGTIPEVGQTALVTGAWTIADSTDFSFGNNDDVQMYYDAGGIPPAFNVDLNNVGDLGFIRSATAKGIVPCIEFGGANASVKMYYGDTPKLETVASGVDVTGILGTTGGLNVTAAAEANCQVRIENTSTYGNQWDITSTDDGDLVLTGNASGHSGLVLDYFGGFDWYDNTDNSVFRMDHSGNIQMEGVVALSKVAPRGALEFFGDAADEAIGLYSDSTFQPEPVVGKFFNFVRFGNWTGDFEGALFHTSISEYIISNGTGFNTSGATGGGKGSNTFNAQKLFENGERVHSNLWNTFAQYTSTDTFTDINGASWGAVPFNSTLDEESGYSLNGSTHEVTLSEVGTYRVYAQVAYETTDTRTNPGLAINVNGTRTGRRGLMGYVRVLEGHNEGSVTIEEWITTTAANQTVSIEAQQYASTTGPCNLISNASILIIERKR